MACIPSLQELLKGIPDEKLNTTWSDVDLARISELIVYWEDLAPFLSLTEAEEAIIKNENSSYPLQKLEMLRLWKSKTKQDATYRQLARIFYRQHKNDLVEKVGDILLNPSELPPTVPMNTLERYQFFLQQTYKSLPHPGVLAEQWPYLEEIPAVYINLTMRDFNCKTSQDAISSLQGEYPLHLGLPIDYGHNEIELHQLFDTVEGRAPISAKRVLIQGCPGSGKSTLTWNASQKWAEKKVFQDFSHFISIPLCIQEIQKAKSLADLILHTGSEEEQKAIANAISRNQGSNVCFWFDGWDELPRDVQLDSYVAHFIRGDRTGAILPASAVVVTARHESRFLRGKSFHRVVDINGLTKRQVHEMVTHSLKNTRHDSESLLRIIGLKHHLQILCSLPITVAILLYLFVTSETDLPDTQTELFKLFILNLLLRHLLRNRNLDYYSLRQFEDLPKDSLKCFRSLCQLAFQGVIETKTSFCRRELPNLQVSLPEATLGLMSILTRFERSGIEEQLAFLHFTLQEFLAAVHISNLDPEEQATKVRKLVISKQYNTLLFYAGLTKLEERTTFDTIHKAATKFSWTNLILDKNLTTFFMLMNCLYETQSPELCHLVKPQPKDIKFNLRVRFYMTVGLNALDLCSFAYFVANYSQKNSCYLNFDGSGGIGCFVEQLRLAILANQSHNQQEIALAIKPSIMVFPSVDDLQSLGHLNMISCLELSLDFCFFISGFALLFPTFNRDRGVIMSYRFFHVTMKYLVEGLSRSTSCRVVRLSAWIFAEFAPNVFEYFEYYLLLLLFFCPSIECLAIKGLLSHCHNYYLFAAALKLRVRGKESFWIDLSDNTFLYNRQNLLLFADVLCTSCAIGTVVLYKSLSSDMLSVILEKLVQNWSSPLQKIYIDISPSCEQIELIRIINRTRMMMTMTDFVPFTVAVNH